MLKKGNLSFVKNLFAASLIVLLLSFYPIYIYANKNQITSFAYGYSVCLANILTGFILIETGMNKGIKKFMAIIFGGMFFRIFVSAALLVLIQKFMNTDMGALVLSFFFFYILFGVMEIKFVHNLQSRRQQKQ